VARLNAELTKVLDAPDTREQMVALGAEPVGGTGEGLAAFIQSDKARWGKIIQEKGIKPE
jgi:tripartite-type tricarboxylate transporter receptor subunit TctC